jgi:tetratricopeptide (TPR) repeat protein
MVTIIPGPIQQILKEAKEAESLLHYDKALELYQNVIVQDPLNEFAYDRLMIIYRKQKLYKKEIETIRRGIKAFEKYYKSRKSRSKKIAEVSEKLNRSLGLADKNGNALFDPEPIESWKKRLVFVEKKTSKAKK